MSVKLLQRTPDNYRSTLAAEAPELKAKSAPIWKNRSPSTQPDLICDVELQEDLPLKIADAVTSLGRIGAGTTILTPANSTEKPRTAAFSSAAHGTPRSATTPSHEAELQKLPWLWIEPVCGNLSTWRTT
jgi:hypothetical protein